MTKQKIASAALIVAALIAAALMLLFCSCGNDSAAAPTSGSEETAPAGPAWSGLKVVGELELQYATQFSVTKYEGGYSLINIGGGDGRCLVVPEGAAAPEGLDEDIVVLYQPLDRIYLASTSAMDFFRALDGIGNIRLSCADADGWYIEEAKAALRDGSMIYAGKYSAPDYELIYSEGCDLAVENTMIYHTPQVKEHLESMGIPVLVEFSSYENNPLGRMEWIKFYGALLGKEELADELFEKEVSSLSGVLDQKSTGKTVAFFYITPTGSVNVHKSGNYVVRMIEMAGGTYVFPDLGDDGNSLSTMNMQMEAFYNGAKDADILIYNSTIGGELQTMDELLAKSSLLADFKAVKNGNVWCTGKNLFQEPMGLGKLILDMHTVFTQDDPAQSELTYLHRLTSGGVGQ